MNQLGGGWLILSGNPEYKDEVIAPHENDKLDMSGRVFANVGKL